MTRLKVCPTCRGDLKKLYERPELETVTYTCTGGHDWVLLDEANDRVVVIGRETCTFQFTLDEVAT